MLENYYYLPISFMSGLASPWSRKFEQSVINYLQPDEIVSYNTMLENIPDEFSGLIQDDNVRMSSLREDLGISRSDFLMYYMSFVDHHRLPVDKFKTYSTGAIAVLELIKEIYSINNQPLGIKEQMLVALKESNNDITLAAIYLALGTRAIARASDTRLFSDFRFDTQEKNDWKMMFKPYGNHCDEEDPLGDTYHFWSGFVAGIGREQINGRSVGNLLRRRCLDAAYTHAGKVVSFARNRLVLKKAHLQNHEEVDVVAYHTGRAVASLLTNNPL